MHVGSSITMINEIDLSQDWKRVFPLIHQLQPHLDEERFHSLVDEMIPQGYQMFGLYIEGEIVAVAGFSISCNLYFERHLWLHDLVTDSSERSKGYGKIILTYIEEYAKRKDCQSIALCSRFDRRDAHRFYVEKMGYEKISYVIKKRLEN